MRQLNWAVFALITVKFVDTDLSNCGGTVGRTMPRYDATSIKEKKNRIKKNANWLFAIILVKDIWLFL